MNNNLNIARKSKKDEFYTLYETIDSEVKHYKKQLENKIIYCNTDTKDSNFTKYFLNNFKEFRLKKLIISDISGEAVIFDSSGIIKRLKIDGDFRSKDSIQLLKEADVVITNPPFSLFREFVNQLIEHNKDFLIIGNFNAVTYKNIFPLIKDNKLRLGYNSNKTITFALHQDYDRWHTIKDGAKYGRVPSITWFTTLKTEGNSNYIELSKKYYGNEESYPKYDNYNAIEVSRVANIPKDYEGVMGVPITFLTKYTPMQFEILGATESEGVGFSNGLHNGSKIKQATINGNKIYKRLFIKRKE